MNLYDKIIKWVVGNTTYLGILALASVMMIIVANIIYRMFGGVIAGTYDLVQIITVVVAAFALTNTEYARKHTTVDMLTIHMKDKLRIYLEQICNLISFIYWVVIGYATLRVTIDKAKAGEVTDMLKVSIIPFRVIWTFALFLMAIIVIYNIYRKVQELKRVET